MANLIYLIFYFVARTKLLIPLEIGDKINISLIFYFFDIINNKNVMIKRILYLNIWSPQDGLFFISDFRIGLHCQALSINTNGNYHSISL